MNTTKKPGEIIKTLIEKRGSTQEKDAAQMGIRQSTLSDFINGKREAKSETLKTLCQFYDISADYLLGLSDVPSTDPDDKAICERFGLKQKDFDLLVNAFNHREEIADAVIEIRELMKNAERLRDLLCFGK